MRDWKGGGGVVVMWGGGVGASSGTGTKRLKRAYGNLNIETFSSGLGVCNLRHTRIETENDVRKARTKTNDR